MMDQRLRSPSPPGRIHFHFSGNYPSHLANDSCRLFGVPSTPTPSNSPLELLFSKQMNELGLEFRPQDCERRPTANGTS